MKTLSTLLIALAIFGMSSCKWIDPDEMTPGYIHIDELSFTAQSGQVTSSHKITEVWVFADGKMLGAYDLPATIPVLYEGNTPFEFRAGIKNNGIASSRIMYPFYAPYTEVLNVQALKTDTVRPEFVYRETVAISLKEDFESQAGTQFEVTSSSQFTWDVVTGEEGGDVFEGDFSAKVTMDGDGIIWHAESATPISGNVGGQMWLELDYKCNNTFAVGLNAVQGDIEAKMLALIINPTNDDGVSEWNKIYVDLTTVGSQAQVADEVFIYFESVRQSNNPVGELWFDNIKLVHF
ncbi:MAG: hypothetical protein ACI84C_001378 [Flavobacteriales bacterium]|jgi:hypothetical protein